LAGTLDAFTVVWRKLIEYHNVVLLEPVLITETLAHAAFIEKPRHFVRRIERLWQPARIASSAPGKRVPWPRAA
jgi:hypothetical protein